MNTVTADAGGDALLSRLQQFSVHAGVVLSLLVDAQTWVKALHQIRVAMTLATIGRDVERLRFSQIALPRILCRFFGVGIWIATMTIVT